MMPNRESNLSVLMKQILLLCELRQRQSLSKKSELMDKLQKESDHERQSFFKRLTEFSFDASSGSSPPTENRDGKEIPYMRMPSTRQASILENTYSPSLGFLTRFGYFCFQFLRRFLTSGN